MAAPDAANASLAESCTPVRLGTCFDHSLRANQPAPPRNVVCIRNCLLSHEGESLQHSKYANKVSPEIVLDSSVAGVLNPAGWSGPLIRRVVVNEVFVS